LRKIGPKNLAF